MTDSKLTKAFRKLRNKMTNTIDPLSNLSEQIINISKAGAFDIVSKQLKEVQEENERLKKIESSFYMNICRAYNAGKQNVLKQIDAEKRGISPENAFQSSHDYFTEEFPEFKTNVP